jgi:Fe/S biogenesis protein NfuA
MPAETETESPETESPDTESPELILAVSETAIEKILEIKAAEDDPGTLVLRVEVTGLNGADYAYDLGFEPRDEVADDDHVSEQGGLTVVVPEASADQLRGAVLDLPTTPGQGGLVIRNPNRPNPMLGAKLDLTGDLADKVQQLLAEAINPSLASHGGFTSLVGVEDTKVFLTMGGGCQGCALSAATLREGIQVAIKEAIPEVTEVIDVTDHDAGESPYYS